MSGQKVTKAYMEVKSGKFASVKESAMSNQLVIFVQSLQQQKEEVNVCWNLGDANSVTMAFGFLHKGKTFSPVVKGDEIKLDEKTDVQTAILDKRCLFQWQEKTGEWGILKSVAEPQKYLRIFNNKVTVGTLYQAFAFRLKSVN